MNDLITNLKIFLNEPRFQHSLNVAEVAVHLAKKHGASCEKAEIAGLLHDCAKERDLSIWHAHTSAELAQKHFGVNDPEILQAIRSHTMGNENMTLLDKIIFVADFIEPSRDFEGIAEIRKVAEKDLDKAVVLAMASTLQYLINNQKFICMNTIKSWNAVMKKDV
jgi:putative nucleotidyltransferase with HDIG domain